MIEGDVSRSELSILEAVRQRGYATRSDIRAAVGLSSAMTARLVARLQSIGLVREAGRSIPTGPGRLSHRLEIHPDVAYVVGVDVGGDVIHLLVANAHGTTRRYCELPSSQLIDQPQDRIVARLAAMVRDIVHEAEVPVSRLALIGMTVTGVIDSEHGICLKRSNTPGWENFPLRAALSAELGLPVIIDETARSKAVAEARLGMAVGRRHFLYVEAGAAIGAGIVIEGQPLRGVYGLAGELGHVIVDPGGPLCRCGNRGCLQASASARALVAHGRELLHRGVFSVLSDRAESLTLADIAAAAAQGDKLALSLLTEAGEQLGTAISMALNILGLDFVVMGGRLAQCSPVIVEAAARVMQLRVLPISPRECTLVCSNLGSDAAARGIVLQTLDQLFTITAEWRRSSNGDTAEWLRTPLAAHP